MSKKLTMASAIVSRFGFSRSEAATFWEVREDTVKKWMSGKMGMPSTIEHAMLDQIAEWQRFCEQMASVYEQVFGDEPETFIAVPSLEECRHYDIPASEGFVANTAAAIAAELSYRGQNHIILVTTDDTEEEGYYQDARKAGFAWVKNYHSFRETESSVGASELSITDYVLQRLKKELQSSFGAQLKYTPQTSGGSCSITFTKEYEPNEEGGDIDGECHFEILFTAYEPDQPFNFDYDDEAVLRLNLEDGLSLQVGLETENGSGDFLGLNAAIADLLNELFVTPEGLTAEFGKRQATTQQAENYLN